jgi:hypothetical protein
MPRNHNNAIAALREALAAGLLVSAACQDRPVVSSRRKFFGPPNCCRQAANNRRLAAFAPQNKSNRFEGGFQIVNQIAQIFDTNRKPNE